MRRNNLKGVRFGILGVRQIGVGLLLVGQIKVFLRFECTNLSRFLLNLVWLQVGVTSNILIKKF